MMKKNTDRAKEFGIKLAKEYYQDFSTHPEYLGPNWKWDQFPEFVHNHAMISTFLYFSRNTTDMPELEKIAARAARSEAKKLMKDGKWKKAIPAKAKPGELEMLKLLPRPDKKAPVIRF